MKKDSAAYGQVDEYDNPLSSCNDNQQHIVDTTINLTEEDFDILSMKLSLQPGSDQSIKNIIITAAISNGITGDAYYIGTNEQHASRRADMIYLPLKKFACDLAPVIVEI
ncbi:hypothetical protein CU097_012721 [Rhizopus azygosporus]|uniref:Uncharacterized protein n=1 Tax=Rhizopus azygosporus TaxID=86630 RepID=A0A367K0D0_RHIAZ|nr:hypothetical protein CU097_012721 [Rhizopus azygosporus]